MIVLFNWVIFWLPRQFSGGVGDDKLPSSIWILNKPVQRSLSNNEYFMECHVRVLLPLLTWIMGPPTKLYCTASQEIAGLMFTVYESHQFPLIRPCFIGVILIKCY